MKKSTRRTLEHLRERGHRVQSLEVLTSFRKPGLKPAFGFVSIVDLGTEDSARVSFIACAPDLSDLTRWTRELLEKRSVADTVRQALLCGVLIQVTTWTNALDIFEEAWQMQTLRLDVFGGRLKLGGMIDVEPPEKKPRPRGRRKKLTEAEVREKLDHFRQPPALEVLEGEELEAAKRTIAELQEAAGDPEPQAEPDLVS